MKQEKIYYQEASTLALMIRNKEITSVEVVQAHIDRIIAIDPSINAVVTLNAEKALKAAAMADQAVSEGKILGPLHGVPFSIKDSIDTAGIVTKRGSKLFTGYLPDSDATVVKRMIAAGAIPLIKTNLPEFSSYWESENRLSGRTVNPWDTERTAGGSSGGEAAAIAAGLSPMGLGSDIAISVRGPAAFTGIAALKATHGRVPYTGHFPSVTSKFWVIGAMARTVKDVALVYSVINGADGIDGYSIFANESGPAKFHAPQKKLRIGWVSDKAFGPVHPEITAAVRDTAKLLDTMGYEVEEADLSFMKEEDWLVTFCNVAYGELVPAFKELTNGREAELDPISIANMDYPLVDAAAYVRDEQKLERLRSHFAAYFQRYDLLLLPVTPVTATIPMQEEHLVDGKKMRAMDVMKMTAPFNATGLPALSVPVTFSNDGLPVNIQLAASWFDERTLLEVGEKIQLASPAYGKHPVG